jgi:hypothetical protein
MKLHTKLTANEVYAAMDRAHDRGVSLNVGVTLNYRGSRSHDHAFDLALASNVNDDLPEGYKDQHGKVMHKRKRRNNSGSEFFDRYAATWFEYGYFMAEIFRADPDAVFTGAYNGAADFHRKTDNQFCSHCESERTKR